MALTIGQYRAKLRGQLKDLTDNNTPLLLGATTGVALLTERIFEKGLNARNTPIKLRRKGGGTGYSTKPVYINPKDSPRKFPVMGKNGDTGPVNGKKRQTRYFKDGYKGFRRAIGREHSKINLRLTNDLQSDISNAATPSGKKVVSKAQRKPVMVSVDEYLVTLKRFENTQKVAGLEKRGGKIFSHTRDEKKEIFKAIQFEAFRVFNT